MNSLLPFFRRPLVIALSLGLLGCTACVQPPATATTTATAAPRPPQQREFDTRTPFVLSGGLDDLPAKPAMAIRTFSSAADFRRFCAEEGHNVWPVGRFAADGIPRDAEKFADILRAHGGEIGADYVVILTAPDEIRSAFHTQFDHLHYGAMAYRRVSARLGVRFESAGAPQALRVASFIPGSQAEAAGIRLDDIIAEIDGTAARADNEDYWKKALRWEPGQTVRVKVLRDRTPHEVDVTLTAG